MSVRRPESRYRVLRVAVQGLLAALILSACTGTQARESEGQVAPVNVSGVQTMMSGGVERSYRLEFPPSYDPEGEPLPLVVALHGNGGVQAGWLDGNYSLNQHVGNSGIMVFPQALTSAAGTTQWVVDRDLPFFAELLDRVKEQVVFDHDRILVTGHSSGAGMANEIGCAYGDRIRAIAPVAGVLTGSECVGSVAVIQVQGTTDTVVPFGLAEQTSHFWARYNGLDPEKKVSGIHDACEAYAGGDARYPVHLCLHNEGAEKPRGSHTWPSIAGPAVWWTFMMLPPAETTEESPLGGGNEAARQEADTQITFTLKFPEQLPSTPTQGAVVVYASGNITPTSAPLAFMSMQFAPGAVSPGEERTYTLPVSYSDFGGGDFTLPGDYTVMVTMHTEDGGYPIPVSGVDLWTMFPWSFVDKETEVVVPDTLQLTPIVGGTGL